MKLIAVSAKGGQAVGASGIPYFDQSYFNNIYLEGVFCTGADILISPFFLYLIVFSYLQTRCKYYIRII